MSSFEDAITGGKSREDTLTLYSTWAKEYDQDMEQKGWNTPRLVAEAALEIVKPGNGARILDVAAGTGTLAKFLRSAGFVNIDALDASAEMLQVARTNNVYQNYYVSFIGSGAELPFQKECYDMVTMSGGFVDGHLALDSWDAMLDATRVGGHVVCGMTKKYLTTVPAYFNMEEYVTNLTKSGKASLVAKRETEQTLGIEAGLIWVLKKL